MAAMKTIRGPIDVDPTEYGATHVTCVWCGYTDRVEFMNVTDKYSSTEKIPFFECKQERACEQRVALSHEDWNE